MNNELALQLHDRFTRGEIISDAEQEQLEQWYELQDNLEAEALNIVPPSESLETLQNQVNIFLNYYFLNSEKDC